MASPVSRQRWTNADGEIENVQLAVRGAPIASNADWLPAVEQFGEGHSAVRPAERAIAGLLQTRAENRHD